MLLSACTPPAEPESSAPVYREPQELAAGYTFSGKAEASNGAKFFRAMDLPENPVEEIVFTQAQNFLTVEDTLLKENVIEELTTLTYEEVVELEPSGYITGLAEEKRLAEYVVVRAVHDRKYEQQDPAMPQYPDGKEIWYSVYGKTSLEGEWDCIENLPSGEKTEPDPNQNQQDQQQDQQGQQNQQGSQSDEEATITIPYRTAYDLYEPDYVYTGETEIVNGEKLFRLEELPNKSVEELVVESYIQSGGYKSLIVQRLYVLDPASFDKYFIRFRANDIKKYNLTEYTVLAADISKELSEEAMAMGPQFAGGDAMEVFLLGKTADNPNWKIYDHFYRTYGEPWEEAPEPWISYVDGETLYRTAYYSGGTANVTNGGRTLVAEDLPANALEAEILQRYQATILDGEGWIQSYTVHNLAIASWDLIAQKPAFEKEVLQDIAAADLYEYTIVWIKYTVTYAEGMEQYAQLPEGLYNRFYLYGRTSPTAEWDDYALYWPEYYWLPGEL